MRIHRIIVEDPIPPEKFNNIEEKIGWAVQELNHAIWKWKPAMVVGLMSGGNDSLPACYIASLAKQFDGILHINTGIGIEDTRVFVRKTCKERKWKLWEYRATENTGRYGKPDPIFYEKLVMRYGFPGAFGHGMMYNRLKLRQILRFKRDHGINANTSRKRIMFVGGVRKQESKRRSKTTQTDLLQIKPSELWAAPIRFWSKQDCREARIYAGLKENPVAFNLHMSGECLCGAFAKKGELAQLEFFYPNDPSVKLIKSLQRRVRLAGHNWGWEDQPPPKAKPKNGTNPDDQFLCVKCNIQNPEEIETSITTL